ARGSLIDMWCLGDKRSVAINTAHFLSALQGGSFPTEAKLGTLLEQCLATSGYSLTFPFCTCEPRGHTEHHTHSHASR
ncbi:Protein IRS1, partial [Dissostichus eleginoides]